MILWTSVQTTKRLVLVVPELAKSFPSNCLSHNGLRKPLAIRRKRNRCLIHLSDHFGLTQSPQQQSRSAMDSRTEIIAVRVGQLYQKRVSASLAYRIDCRIIHDAQKSSTASTAMPRGRQRKMNCVISDPGSWVISNTYTTLSRSHNTEAMSLRHARCVDQKSCVFLNQFRMAPM